ncbi:MAG: universal stress protein [Verrucomicrobia bacterium]|nr:MAG: universal stress protein [Verrucomicrobiota bacterium]
MYKNILIPVENSPADVTILGHVRQLARLTGSRLILLHVATGWVARNYDQLNLAESEEMRDDRAYLESLLQSLQAEGFSCECELARGEPANEIIRVAETRNVDLIAMSTHGHRFLQDLIYGSTADHVRHLVGIPVLLLKVPNEKKL